MLAGVTRGYPDGVDPIAISASVDREILILGCPSAYARLADDIEAGWRGRRSLSGAPQATCGSLEELEIVETRLPRIRFRAVDDRLVVSGSTSALSLLARNLRGLGTVVKVGTHGHWEHLPGVENHLIDVESMPVVTEVLSE